MGEAEEKSGEAEEKSGEAVEKSGEAVEKSGEAEEKSDKISGEKCMNSTETPSKGRGNVKRRKRS